MTQTHAKRKSNPAQPVWPAVVAVLAVGGLHLALPEPLTFGPSWLLLAVVLVLLVPVLIARMRGSFDLNQRLGYVLLAVVTAAMLWSLNLLVWSLPRHTLPPSVLLRSAAFLWITNILVFASWYWRLDAGGPHARHVSINHTKGDFLFPQMTLAPGTQKSGRPDWTPGLWTIFPGLQYQHRLLAHRYARACPLGQGADDGAIQHLARHPGPAGGARREHPVTVQN